MNVPREILDDYKELKTAAKVTFNVRALTNIDNEKGETYVIGDEQSLVVYSGRFGQRKERKRIFFDEILEFDVKEEKHYLSLSLVIEQRQMLMKFVKTDFNKLRSIKRLWDRRQRGDGYTHDAASEVRPQRGATTARTIELTPRIAFSAALHSMILIDDESPEIKLRLLQLLVMDQRVIDRGLEYLKQVGTTELIVILSTFFSEEQKRCLVINLIDMAMIDGRYRSSEREYLEYIRDIFEIAESDYNTIFDHMMLKNALHVFETTTICDY